MRERRALVIGSQCSALPTLDFLPLLAKRLYHVLTDPGYGGCTPALVARKGLLLDPTVNQAHDVLEKAVARAHYDEAALIISYIGHGVAIDDDFYLMPSDASYPPDGRKAVHIVERMKEWLRKYQMLDGLVLVIDACASGEAAVRAAKDCPKVLIAVGGRLEVVTAADIDPAYDGCFTKALIGLLREGKSAGGPYLNCADVHEYARAQCANQVPTRMAFDGSRVVRDSDEGDPGLWLGRNPARSRLVCADGWALTEQLTACFEPTEQLAELVSVSLLRHLVVVGPRWVGKSALAAALARPERAAALVPPEFVHSIVFGSATLTPDAIADDLHRQLAATVQGFAEASRTFRNRTRGADWDRLDVLSRRLLGPLSQLPRFPPIRLVIDGLDRLTEPTSTHVRNTLVRLIGDTEFAHIRLVLTTRSDTPLPDSTEVLEVGLANEADLRRYLERRSVPPALHPEVLQRAGGQWLLARVLADVASHPASGPLPTTLTGLFKARLRLAGANDSEFWEEALRPVLSVLTVASVGPVAPLGIIAEASRRLGGPPTPARVRDVLARLGNLVVRADPGTPFERVGAFHESFDEYLAANRDLIDLDAAKDALLASINTLAPPKERYLANHLHRYALRKVGTLQASATAATLLRNDEGILELLKSIESATEELDSLLELLSQHPEVMRSAAAMQKTRLILVSYQKSLYSLQETDLWDIELQQALQKTLQSTFRSYEKSSTALMTLRDMVYDFRAARSLLELTLEFWHSVRQLLQDTDRLLFYLRRPLRRAGYGEPEGFKRVDLALSRFRKKLQDKLLAAGGGRGH